MLSITFKTNALSFFFSFPLLSANEDTSPFPRPSPLSPPVALFIFFLSPSTCSLPAAQPLSPCLPPSLPPPSPLTVVSHTHFLPNPTLPPPTHNPTLPHSITFSLDYSISPSHLLDIPALFCCSLQHNFLTHFLSPPWPPDQSLQDGIALGRREGAQEMGGMKGSEQSAERKRQIEKG